MPPSLVGIPVMLPALCRPVPGLPSCLVVLSGKGGLTLQRGFLVGVARGRSSLLVGCRSCFRVMGLWRRLRLMLVSQSSARGRFLGDLDQGGFGRLPPYCFHGEVRVFKGFYD